MQSDICIFPITIIKNNVRVDIGIIYQWKGLKWSKWYFKSCKIQPQTSLDSNHQPQICLGWSIRPWTETPSFYMCLLIYTSILVIGDVTNWVVCMLIIVMLATLHSKMLLTCTSVFINHSCTCGWDCCLFRFKCSDWMPLRPQLYHSDLPNS